MKLVARFVKDESGATAIEYGLIAALISVAIIGGATALGSNAASTFDNVAGRCSVDTSRHTVKYYFRTIPALYSAVVDHKDCNPEIAEKGRALGYGTNDD